MQFSNQFEVSLPPEQAWPLLMNVEAVVPCMPGAELVQIIDERTFKGKVAVKLGPVGLTFLCDATFEDVDNDAHKAVIKANGSDAKGRGAALASIDFSCQPSAAGSRILITTDLELSGAVAQYGRGVGLIQNVANQIIAQFSKNLEARIAYNQAQEDDAPTPAGTPLAPSTPSASNSTRPAALPPSAAAAPGAYPDIYRDAYAAGFAAGHAAGYDAAATLMAAGHPAYPRRVAPPPAKPIGGLSLFFSSLWATVRGWFGRSS